MNIGTNIKELRQQQNVTQESLAKYLNVSMQAVSKWERGLSLPHITQLPYITKFFSVTADKLLSDRLDKDNSLCYNCYQANNMEDVMDNKNRLGIEIKAISNRMMRKLGGEGVGIDNELITSAQKRVIIYLYEQKDNGDIFQRDVEQYLSIRRPTATRMLNNMEENGFVRRESVEYDGRLKKLTLTQKSIDLYNDIFNEIDIVEKNMTRGLTEEEKKEFLRIARKIRKNLE